MVEISLCMIVKNESEYIEQALKSAIPFVQEIIVIDTGSMDQTPEIARQLGAHVFSAKWNNNFGEMRNLSIEKATKPFIMVMDADETVIEANIPLVHECCEYIKKNQGSAGTVNLRNETVSGDVSLATLTRLFPRDERYRYQGRVHEQLNFEGKIISHTVDTKLKFNHSGYNELIIKKKNKYERNISLLELEIQEQTDQSYVLYQMGQTYYVMKEYVQAEKHLKKCIELELKASRRNFLASALLSLGYCCIHLRKFEEFIQCYELGIEFFPDYTDLYFMCGTGLIEWRNINTFKKIPVMFEKCVQLGEITSAKYESVIGVGSYKARFNLGLYYEIIGNLNEAVHHYQLSAKDGYEQAIVRLSQILQ